MNKLSKNEEIEKLKQALMERIKSENDSRYIDLNPDEVMQIIIDSSNKGKYVLWVLREYLKGNIQKFEDMGRCKQALTLFKNNLSKFTDQQKQLNKMSFQELETLVSPYQDVLTQNAVKRINKEKIWAEIDVIYEGVEGRIYSPKTREASIFLGQGTKWCTASINNNMFESYNSYGPLFVFVLGGKDEKGREEKYQLHFTSHQFMDSEDKKVRYKFNSDLLKLLFCFGKSLSFSKKIKIFENIKFNFNDPLIEIIFDKNKVSNDFFCSLLREHYFLFGDINVLNFDNIKYLNKETFIDILTYSDYRDVKGKLMRLISKKLFPEKFMTIDFFEAIISKKSENISYIEIYEHFPDFKRVLFHTFFGDKSQKMCEKALFLEKPNKISDFVITHIPEKMRTKKMYMLSFEKNPLSIRFIPEKLITKEMVVKAFKSGYNKLNNIHSCYLDDEIVKLFVQNGGSLIDLPPHYKTQEIFDIAVEKNDSNFSFVKNNFITQEMCNKITKNKNNIEYIPDEFKTEELCLMSIKNSIRNFDYIPKNMMTEDFVLKAFNLNPYAVKFMKQENITDQFIFELYNREYDGLSEGIVREAFNILDIKDKEFLKKLIEHKPKNAKFLFDLLDNDLCLFAFEKDVQNFHLLRKELRTKDLCHKLVLKHSEFLSYIPHEFVNEKIVNQIFNKDPDSVEHIAYTTGNFLTEYMTKHFIELKMKKNSIFTFEDKVEKYFERIFMPEHKNDDIRQIFNHENTKKFRSLIRQKFSEKHEKFYKSEIDNHIANTDLISS